MLKLHRVNSREMIRSRQEHRNVWPRKGRRVGKRKSSYYNGAYAII